MSHHGVPLGHARRQAIAQAGVDLATRVAGIQAGKFKLEDGRVLSVEAVIWATGFQPDYRWINLPIFDQDGYPRHARGTVQDVPGLCFLGLLFQKALSSALLGGVGEDAAYLVNQIGRNDTLAT